MSRKISGEDVEDSEAYARAKSRASAYAQDPDKLNDLVDRASRKAKARQGRLTQVWESLTACFRLLRAYATGQYREIPWASLLSIIAAVVYFVMPLDLIPDFLLGFGMIDDAVLIGWILGSLRGDIERFLEWEGEREDRQQAESQPAAEEDRHE